MKKITSHFGMWKVHGYDVQRLNKLVLIASKFARPGVINVGLWSAPKPSCLEVNLPPPCELFNVWKSQIEINSITYFSRYQVTCFASTCTKVEAHM